MVKREEEHEEQRRESLDKQVECPRRKKIKIEIKRIRNKKCRKTRRRKGVKKAKLQESFHLIEKK